MYSEFQSERFVTSTRRFHRCNWCGQQIEPRNKAFYFAGKWDDFADGYMHMECYHAYKHIDWREMQDGYEPESYGRGRRDDDKHASPEYDPNGNKL
jgi:hypothetical protein